MHSSTALEVATYPLHLGLSERIPGSIGPFTMGLVSNNSDLLPASAALHLSINKHPEHIQ